MGSRRENSQVAGRTKGPSSQPSGTCVVGTERNGRRLEEGNVECIGWDWERNGLVRCVYNLQNQEGTETSKQARRAVLGESQKKRQVCVVARRGQKVVAGPTTSNRS